MSRACEGLVQRFGIGGCGLIQGNLWKSHPGGVQRSSRLYRGAARTFRGGARCEDYRRPQPGRPRRPAGRGPEAIPCGAGLAGRGERSHPCSLTPPGRGGIKSLGGGRGMCREGPECPALSRKYGYRESRFPRPPRERGGWKHFDLMQAALPDDPDRPSIVSTRNQGGGYAGPPRNRVILVSAEIKLLQVDGCTAAMCCTRTLTR